MHVKRRILTKNNRAENKDGKELPHLEFFIHFLEEPSTLKHATVAKAERSKLPEKRMM